MNHPTSLLAEYVDDALAPSERERVQAHLGSCASCASEVRAAIAGRDALRALSDEPVPLGVTSSVIAEAEAGGGAPRVAAAAGASVQLRPKPQRSRYSGLYRVVAAAAVIAVVGVLATSLMRKEGQEAAAPAAMTAAKDFMETQDDDPGKLDRDGNYTAGELTAYAEREVRAYGPQPDLGDEGAPAAAPVASASPAVEDAAGAAETSYASNSGSEIKAPPGVDAISNSGKYRKCLDTIGAYDHGGELVSSFEGRYLDVPAFFATLTEGPDAGEPHDRLVVWVLRKEDCWVLAFTQKRFPSATPSPLPTDYMHPVP